MILGIVGSRKWGSHIDPDINTRRTTPHHKKVLETVLNQIRENKEIDEVTSGGAQGPDMHGECWARSHGIPCKIFVPRTWESGDFETEAFLRNTRIAEYCTLLVAFWNGKSRGTLDTMQKVLALGKKVYVCDEDGELKRWKG